MYFKKQSVLTANAYYSKTLEEWKSCEGSLTDKLKASIGVTELQLLFQNWTQSTWWDRYILKLGETAIFQREIMMKHQNKKYWYARSIIPQSCYALNPTFFKRLEDESIRNLIFDEPTVTRVNMLCYPIDALCIEYYWVKKYLKTVDSILWVRLAEYCLQGTESFYLVEILLPELELL